MDQDLKHLIGPAVAALKAAGAREVYLFGSAARGECDSGSDIDIAVVGLPPASFFAAVCDASDALRHPVDLVDLDEDTPFTRHLREEGELQRVG